MLNKSVLYFLRNFVYLFGCLVAAALVFSCSPPDGPTAAQYASCQEEVRSLKEAVARLETRRPAVMRAYIRPHPPNVTQGFPIEFERFEYEPTQNRIVFFTGAGGSTQTRAYPADAVRWPGQ